MDGDPSPEARHAAPAPAPSPMSASANHPRLPSKATRIGRTPDNDLVVADLDVSRHHAELRKSPAGGYEIIDLGSHNGTLVNGKQVSQATLTERDIVSIGHSTFRLAEDELRPVDDTKASWFQRLRLVISRRRRAR